MNNISNQTLKEIVDFINETGCSIDQKVFERLNSDELLNIYVNCLIYLKFANSYKDFELNSEEENLFATVVKDNRTLKIIKVTALINHVFKKFGYIPDFSPVYILNPTDINIQSTFLRLMDTNKKMKEFITKFNGFYESYQYTVKSRKNLIDILNEAKNKNRDLTIAHEEGNKLVNEVKNIIENYTKKVNEISPLINNNKETINQLNSEYEEKLNKKNNLSKKIDENTAILNKLKESIVPDPEQFNNIIENNKIQLNNLNTQQNNLKQDLDNLNKNNEACSKIYEKLINIKKNVEEFYDYDMKNKKLYEQKEQLQNIISSLESELNDCKGKYEKNSEILKNTKLMLKNHQKEFNNLKNKLSAQIKENETIKNDLKATLEHINDEIANNKSEIDRINDEKREIMKIRNEFAEVLRMKFQNIYNKQNLYYKLLDKSLELYQSYSLFDKKELQK